LGWSATIGGMGPDRSSCECWKVDGCIIAQGSDGFHHVAGALNRPFGVLFGAGWLLAAGSASEAFALGEVALAGHLEALGPTHLWTKDSARITADALAALNRAKEAAAMRIVSLLPSRCRIQSTALSSRSRSWLMTITVCG
jgi:hypothetical protein